MSSNGKEGFIEKALGWVKARVPVVGGLAGDGARTSGAAASVGGAYLILDLECEAWIKAVCLTAIVIGWCISGAVKR